MVVSTADDDDDDDELHPFEFADVTAEAGTWRRSDLLSVPPEPEQCDLVSWKSVSMFSLDQREYDFCTHATLPLILNPVRCLTVTSCSLLCLVQHSSMFVQV